MTIDEAIADRWVVRGTCTSCQRHREVNLAVLPPLPTGTTLDDVASRMRCQVCDERTIRLTAVRRPATLEEVMAHPAVRAVMEMFPGAQVSLGARRE